MTDLLTRVLTAHDPEHAAVETARGAIGYAELLAATSELATSVNRTIVGARSVVVLTRRGDAGAVLMLVAMLRSGRSPLLVDADASAQRVGTLADLIGASVVDTTGRLVRAAALTGPKLITEDDDDAYLVATSGSTGTPRVVSCRWSGLELVASELVRRYHIDRTSRVFQFAAPPYDAFVADVVPTLIAGGTIVCTDDESWSSPRRVLRALERKRVTHATFPPSFLKELLPHWGDLRLATLVSAGEVLEPSLLRQLTGKADHVVNAYGPCEATICAASHEISDFEQSPVPVGTPLEMVSIDMVGGRIRIAGPTVASRYVGVDQSTDGFHLLPDGTAAFQTGDAGRIEDGLIYVEGRADRERKIRGRRIDLGAIEQVLNSIDHVQRTAAIDLHGELGVAVVTDVELSTIVREARRLLPLSDFPSRWLRVERIPHLVSDKLDVAALRDCFDSPSQRIDRQESPTGDWLLELWTEYVANPTRDSSDFFMQGGTSLAAMELLDQVFAHVGREVDLADFIVEPTLGRLRELVEAACAD